MVCALGWTGSPAFAQSSDLSCPPPGTSYTLSNGGYGEAVGKGPGQTCRFKSLRTGKEFDRLYGSFDPGSPLVKANLEKFQALAPLRVGQKISFQHTGPGTTGGDGTWFYDVVVERAESITTPAGTFPTLVLLLDEQSPQFAGRWQQRYWYSPQVGYAVKYEYKTLHGMPPRNGPQDWVLTEYKPAPKGK